MNDDAALLRVYADEGSEPAFAELVRRHVDLVYGAAMRRTGGDAHLSADVAQQVFAAMARHARELAEHSALGAWLHTATRNAALKAMIAEQRRRAREASAAEPAPVALDLEWERLRPLLDEIIDELPEPDRASLVLRFFERRPFAEIGAALRVSEDAARMRTERALDKLREALGRRGIASTAAAIAAVVSGQPVVTAPAGLATTIAAETLASGGAVAAAGGSMLTAKFALIATGGAVAAFVIGSFVGARWNDGAAERARAAQLERTVTELRTTNGRLESDLRARSSEVAVLKEKNAALEEEQAQAEIAPLPAAPVQAPRRGLTLGLARYEVQQQVLNNLRQIAAARDQYTLENGHAPASVEELVGRGGFIRALRTVDGEDYSQLPMNNAAPLTVTTPDGIAVTFDPAGVATTKPDVPPEIARVQELERKVQPTVMKAVSAYRAANGGANPPDEQALLPFFATPQEGADFVEYLDATKAATGGGGR